MTREQLEKLDAMAKPRSEEAIAKAEERKERARTMAQDVNKTFWYKMQCVQHKRRNISGIYIFDKFPTDEKRQPTCIEDCIQDTRRAWLMERCSTDCAKQAITMVYDAFVGLCDYLHKEGCIKDEWHKDFISMANEKKEMTKCNLALHELANILDEACDKLCLCADACGVEKKGGEE